MANAYLLDTNILVHIVRQTALADYVRQKYQPLLITPRPSISVVTEGELRSLVIQWSWGKQKKEQVRFLLSYFLRTEVNDEDVFSAYAAIDSHNESTGHPMGKNDLWIAAAAYATNSTLVTTDKDFNHLHPDFILVDWIDPERFRPRNAGPHGK